MPASYGWKSANWPFYIVWDKYQQDFIMHNVANSPEILVTKEVWWSDDCNEEIHIQNHKTIAVFDVEPHRDSYYQSYALGYEYFTPDVAINFLKDIQSTLDEFGIYLAIKQKRSIGNKKHPRYESFINNIEKVSNVIIVPPSISASRLIESAIAVISMPFTSTAILGVNRNKPSIFYDSNNGVNKNDCAAHGIEVILGKEELRIWVKNNLKA